MTDGTFRGRWVDEVFRSPHITDAVRVALLAMATRMDEAGRVSIPREDLALLLNRGKARVSERLQAAVDAGLLVRTVEGKKGRIAEYVGALPFGSGYADRIQAVEDAGKGPDTRTESASPDSGSGPDERTESEHFGSGLQTQSGDDHEGKGPDCRPKVSTLGPDTRTPSADKGSGYADPLCSKGVEVADDVDEVADDGGLFKEGSVAKRRPPKPKQKRSTMPRTSIPADFAVDDAMRAWAREKTPDVDIDLQTMRFVNHFIEKPQIKRPGWLRSWQNWMAQQQDWANERKAKVTQLRPAGTGGKYTPSGSDVPDRDAYDVENFI